MELDGAGAGALYRRGQSEGNQCVVALHIILNTTTQIQNSHVGVRCNQVVVANLVPDTQSN